VVWFFPCLCPIYDGPAWRHKAIGLEAPSACGESQQEQANANVVNGNAATESNVSAIPTANLNSVRNGQAVADTLPMLFSYHSGYGPRSRVFTVYVPMWVP
jgi:hypothetical protein